MFLDKPFAGTDLFAGTGLLAYGSQNQLFTRCNGGNGKQDSPCLVHKAHKARGECFNRTSFCIWVKGTQILAIEGVFAQDTIILAPLYGPTMNQLLPGASRMFKALWDRSESRKTLVLVTYIYTYIYVTYIYTHIIYTHTQTCIYTHIHQ